MSILNDRKFRSWSAVLSLAALAVIAGCSSSSDDDGGTCNFNGTFGGTVQVTDSSGTMPDTITLALQCNSPLTGTLTTSDGGTGTLTGDATGDNATFNLSVSGTCPGTLNGVMTLSGSSLSFDASGDDCNGTLSVTGNLTSGPVNANCDNCAFVAGTWQNTGTETTNTCDKSSGTDSSHEIFERNGCFVSIRECGDDSVDVVGTLNPDTCALTVNASGQDEDDGCVFTETVNATLTFSGETMLSGQVTAMLQRVSGECPAESCQVVEQLSGTKISSCPKAPM